MDATLDPERQKSPEAPAGAAFHACVTLPVLAAITGLVLAGLLWWRYGDTVFATSMLNAFMACF